MKHLALVCTGLLVPVVTIVFSYATPNPTPYLVAARTPAPFHTESPPPPVPTPSVYQQVKATTSTWIKPVPGPIPNPFGNGYPFYGIYRGGHTGVDIKAKIGTPVKAVAAGVVRYIRNTQNMRYGFYVVIEHSPQLFSLYGHLHTISAYPGQKIKQGQVIGTVGTTGAASYPHLHFEVLNKMPLRDGAWGYFYICQMPQDQTKINYLQVHAKKIDFIQRMYAGRCQSTTKVDITYYNPEHFFPAEEDLEHSTAVSEPPSHESFEMPASSAPLQETPLPYPTKATATPPPMPTATPTPKPTTTSTPLPGPKNTAHPGLPWNSRRH